MIQNKRLKYAEVALLVLIWVVLITAPALFNNEDFFQWEDFFRPMRTLVPLFIIFLINRIFLVPQLLLKGKNLYYLLSVFVLIAFFTVGSFLIFEKNANRPGEHNLPPQRFMIPPPMDQNFQPPPEPARGAHVPQYINLLMFSLLLVGFDTGLRVSFRLTQTEREKAKLEKENVGTQLAFLRNQVSPHFFMNTLNNIHALIDYDSEEAKESIIRLSKLMRHLLYDSEIEKITLQKEVDFIKNYVDLMKLRFSEKVKINLLFPPVLPDKKIPPLLFTSYLENAFKHGISYQKTSFITISFLCSDKRVTFEIKNSNANIQREDKNSGIGKDNSRKRLDLLYGDTYSLDIEDTEEEHFVRLVIPI